MPSWTSSPGTVSGRWIAYRHVGQGLPALWYGGGSTTVRQESGRWHREGESLAQYLALSSDGAWAELIRYLAIRTEARRARESRRLWQIRVVADRIADLSTFGAWEAAGLDPALAVGDHEPCQVIGAELRHAGYDGVLAPSAALDVAGAVNLTLFGGRIEHRIEGRPLPDEPIAGGPWLPTVLLTDKATPTRFAMERTCYIADHHRTLAEWRATRAEPRRRRR